MVSLVYDGREIEVDFVYVMFPNGTTGYRIEVFDSENNNGFAEDIGTMYYDTKEKGWNIVNW